MKKFDSFLVYVKKINKLVVSKVLPLDKFKKFSMNVLVAAYEEAAKKDHFLNLSTFGQNIPLEECERLKDEKLISKNEKNLNGLWHLGANCTTIVLTIKYIYMYEDEKHYIDFGTHTIDINDLVFLPINGGRKIISPPFLDWKIQQIHKEAASSTLHLLALKFSEVMHFETEVTFEFLKKA